MGELERAFCKKVIWGPGKNNNLVSFFKLFLKIKKIKLVFYSLLVSFWGDECENGVLAWFGLKKQVILNCYLNLILKCVKKKSKKPKQP